MNSCYGKTILKPSKSKDLKFYSKEAFDNYMNKNYNLVDEWKTNENSPYIYFDKYENEQKRVVYSIVKKEPVYAHKNRPHCGCIILSMSKRIMNEVMCLAEDLGMDIYYQDTDSMHILNSSLTKLSEEYKKIYNRDLQGKEMGQFHPDFEGNAASIKLIALQKKIYYDHLVKIKPAGFLYEIDWDNKVQDHVRMKGVSENAITEREETINEIYEGLFNGKKYKMDLTAGGIKKFKYNNEFNTISTLKDFTREIKCNYPIGMVKTI